MEKTFTKIRTLPIPNTKENSDRFNKAWLLIQIGYQFVVAGFKLARNTTLFRHQIKNVMNHLNDLIHVEQRKMNDATAEYVGVTYAIFARLVDQLETADEAGLNQVITYVDELVNGRVLIASENQYDELDAQLEQRPDGADPGEQVGDFESTNGTDLVVLPEKKQRKTRSKSKATDGVT